MLAQALPKASVHVYESAKNGGIEYRFEIINSEVNSISQFTVGIKLDPLSNEVVEFPIGWSPKKSDAGLKSPKDWKGSVVLQEESKFYSLSWEAVTPASKVKPGEKLAGFTVMLPKADKSLIKATYNLYPSNSPPISRNLSLAKDNIPQAPKEKQSDLKK